MAGIAPGKLLGIMQEGIHVVARAFGRVDGLYRVVRRPEQLPLP